MIVPLLLVDPSPVTRDGAQREAKDELAKAIYHRQSDPWEVRAVRWFGHIIDRILGKTLSHAPVGSFGALALVVLIVVIVAVVIWRVGVPRRAAAIGSVLAGVRAQTAAEHRRLSDAAAGGGDWNIAVLERMRAIARELEERSVLDPRAGRTATELSNEAGRALPHVVGSLRSAADTFNAVIYGGRPAQRTDLDVLIASDDLIRASKPNLVMAT